MSQKSYLTSDIKLSLLMLILSVIYLDWLWGKSFLKMNLFWEIIYIKHWSRY